MLEEHEEVDDDLEVREQNADEDEGVTIWSRMYDDDDEDHDDQKYDYFQRYIIIIILL